MPLRQVDIFLPQYRMAAELRLDRRHFGDATIVTRYWDTYTQWCLVRRHIHFGLVSLAAHAR